MLVVAGTQKQASYGKVGATQGSRSRVENLKSNNYCERWQHVSIVIYTYTYIYKKENIYTFTMLSTYAKCLRTIN